MTHPLPTDARWREGRRGWREVAAPPHLAPNDDRVVVVPCQGHGCEGALRLTYTSRAEADAALADLAWQLARYQWHADPPLCARHRVYHGDELTRLRHLAWEDVYDNVTEATEHGTGYVVAEERAGRRAAIEAVERAAAALGLEVEIGAILDQARAAYDEALQAESYLDRTRAKAAVRETILSALADLRLATETRPLTGPGE